MSRNSPLYKVLGQPGEPLALIERVFLGHIILRGNADDDAFLGAASAALGVAPPRTPNTLARTAEVTVLWLGPDEWLVQTSEAGRAAVLDALREALAGQHAAVTDVSDGHTVIVLDDPRAADLLSRGCPLDFHLAVFPVDTCAQSVLGKAGVLLLRETAQCFAIVVRRSFAEYLYHALQDAGALALA